MQVQAAVGIWDYLLFWIFTGSSLLGLPPGERDPALIRSVPPQTLAYFEWAERGRGLAGGIGIDGFAADPEIRRLVEQIDATLAENSANQNLSQRSNWAQLAFIKRLTSHPGCVFVGFEPLPAADSGIANWVAMLRGLHGGMILNGGEEADLLWRQIGENLMAIPNFQFDERNATQSIPVPIPGYQLVLHREGQRIIFAVGEGTLPRILNGLTGTIPGLDTNPRFLGSLDRIAVPRVSTIGWFDIQGTMTSALAALGPVGVLVRPILTIVRVDALDHVVQVQGVDQAAMVQRMFVATGGRTDGILVLAAGKPIQARQFAHIPADADLVVAASISFEGVFQEIRKLLLTARPLSVHIFDEAVRQFETDVGLKIVDEILPAFGDCVTAFDSPSAGGVIASSLVVCFEVRDVQKAALVFDRLLKLVAKTNESDKVDSPIGEGVNLRQGEFLGQKVFYLMKTGNGSDNAWPITPTFCLTNRHLICSLHPQAMKSQLRHLYSGNAAFDRKVIDSLGQPAEDAIFLAYLNGPRAYGIVSAIVPYWAQRWLSQIPSDSINVDPFSIPSATALASYFGDSTAIVRRQRDGMVVETRNAPPVIAGLALASAYENWSRLAPLLFDVGQHPTSDGGGEPVLGPVTDGENVPPSELKEPQAPVTKTNPSPYRKLAPLYLRALIPDDVQKMIPESTFRQLEEGPSPAVIQRREEARQKREERRRRRIEANK